MGMSDHDTFERLLNAIDHPPDDYDLAVTLLPDLDTVQQREVLAIVCAQNRRTDEAHERRHLAFLQTLLSTFPGVVGATGVFGETALHIAAYWSNFKLMRVLLDGGADLDKRTPKSWHYNDGTLPKGTTAQSLLARNIAHTLKFWAGDDARIEDGLERLRNDDLPAAGYREGIPLVFGTSFDAWFDEVRAGGAASRRRPGGSR